MIEQDGMRLRQGLRLVSPEEFVVDATLSPEEMVNKVKRALKKYSPEMALVVFARVMTSSLSSQIKSAVWSAVRYSQLWWGVDNVLKGEVMKHPLVQIAFADAVPMRQWMAENAPDKLTREIARVSVRPLDMYEDDAFKEEGLPAVIDYAINALVRFEDGGYESRIAKLEIEDVKQLRDFRDSHGNNLLWYLTYRDDQQAKGGFAAPKNERFLLELGVDPTSRNDMGLCWNDVRQHVNRDE